MPSLRSILRPCSTSDSPPTPTNSDPTSRSRIASSCELFTILKALAASASDDDLESPSSRSDSSLPYSLPADHLNTKLTALSLSSSPELSISRPTLPRTASRVDSMDWTDTNAAGNIVVDDATRSKPVDATDIESTSPPLPSSESLQGAESPSATEKVAAIIAEFGDLASLFQSPSSGPETERLLAEAKGSLFKGVMMVGNLNLTTHRLLFHALLPPESVLLNESAIGDALMAGPVTLDRHGLKTSRRLWMEVQAEMITTYPRGDESGRTRPLQTILLSNVNNLAPYNPETPRHFSITYESASGSHELDFDVDNDSSAMRWRRALESALFRHARRRWRENIAATSRKVDVEHDGWSTMRCCVPLDRVKLSGISQYHGFATLAGLEVAIDNANVQWRPEDVAAGDYSGRLAEGHGVGDTKHKSPLSALTEPLRRRSSSPARSDTHPSHREHTQYIDTTLPPRLSSIVGASDSGVRTPGDSWRLHSGSYDFNVAVLNDQAWFAEALQTAIEAAHERIFLSGKKSPNMTLEIAGYDCLADDEEDEPASTADRHSGSSEEPRTGLHAMTHDMRKAEKAVLAAKVFGLKEDEGVYLKRCYVVQGVIPARGHIIISRSSICFWRRAAVGDDIKYRFAITDVKGAEECPSLRTGFHGMALKIHGQHDLRFEFWSRSSRDDVLARIKAISVHVLDLTPVSSPTTISPTLSPALRTPHAADILVPDPAALFGSRAFPDEAFGYMPFVANKPLMASSRLTPRHFVCLTIGSRGDVQPYIALGLRLKQDLHRVTIVTHPEFKDWIISYGIEHREAGGDPTALMKLSAEHKMFSPGFFKESLGSFRQWLDDLLLDSWNACQGADVLIESPSTMSGVHIAEALKIPYFRAFTMPWTRTTAYPQAFMVPAFEMGPSFNYSTYVLFDNILWRATAGQINRWRKRHLALPSTDMSSLSISKVPFLYNFSPAVVPKPLDWHDEISVTGYWNLEDSDADWSPPPALEAFITQAKTDGKPLVYIGFGSIVVPKPAAMTRSITAAVEKAGVRAIIAKGWSSRGADEEEVEFPTSCYGLEKVPHGWLFPKVACAMHHGGAGTVGASLRAGIPTLIKPWFGDQFFWAIRVAKLGAGLKVPSLRTDDIAHALIKATTDKTMIEKAARVGAKIRSESGVDNALQAIHSNIVRAGDRTIA